MTSTYGSASPVLLDGHFPLPLRRPFTTQQAMAVGVSRHVLARLVRDGYLRRLLKGVYVAAQADDGLLLRARALTLVAPENAVVTDWTACWLFTGVLPPGQHLDVPPVCMFRLSGHTRLRNGLCSSGERTLHADDVMDVEGLTVTTPLRTALDLGRLSHRDLAIGALDALLRLAVLTKEELLDGVERFARQRGVVQLRALAPIADPRAESPGESVLRLRWLDMPTLPAPTPQIPILAPDGREIYRIDLGVEELLFGAEYDGEQWHSGEEALAHDSERRQWLYRHRGWVVEPVTRHNVFGAGRDVERILYEGIVAARRTLGRFRPSA